MRDFQLKAEPGHINGMIEQSPDGDSYAWSVDTAGSIWMGTAKDAEIARAMVDCHVRGIIKTRRHHDNPR